MEDQLINRDSLNGQAYRFLCRYLKSGRYAPGEKLKLRDVAAELGISPTPVREALSRLISEQALEQINHHSVRVPVMSEERFAEVRDLRIMLEGEAAARAAAHAQPKDVRRLEELHEQMVAARAEGDEAGELLNAERFHMEVYALARMPVLLRIVESLWLQCGPLMKAMQAHPLDRPHKQHPHHKVLRGLRKNDGDIARQGIQEEIERTTSPILTYLQERGDLHVAAPGKAVSRGVERTVD